MSYESRKSVLGFELDASPRKVGIKDNHERKNYKSVTHHTFGEMSH